MYGLILDRDPVHADALAHFGTDHGIQMLCVSSLDEAKAQVAARDVALAFIDLDGGADDEKNSGLSLFEDGTLHGIETVLMSEHDNVLRADEAIRNGASYYFCKPFDPRVLDPFFKDIVQEVAAYAKPEIDDIPCSVDQFGFLRGSSSSMRNLYRLLRKVSQTDASLLIVGESGTGKELVAQTVHTLSGRSDKPFIAVNCAAVAESIIESELFGHEKGSFSGAFTQHKGLFEQANGGTLFLDEITEMDVNLQTKLLRVLETKQFRRVGSESLLSVDVRFLSAMNLSPDAAIAEGKLREDLYYRLAQFPVLVPTLRQRGGGDIAGLAQYFLNALNAKHDTLLWFTPNALEVIRNKRWPGNVRELKNFVERAYIVSDSVIDVDDLPSDVRLMLDTDDATSPLPQIPVACGISLADSERMLILASLERHAWDKMSAATELGISLKTLYNRLKQYESQAPEPSPRDSGSGRW